MSLRILFIIVITAALTVFFMQNSEPVTIRVLFETMTMSKQTLMPGLLLFGFITGYIMGLAGKRKARKQKEARLAEALTANRTIAPEGSLHAKAPATPLGNASASGSRWGSGWRYGPSRPLSPEDETYLKD